MQSHVLVHPSLQVAKRKTQRGIRSGQAVWVSVVPAGCTCPVLMARGRCSTFFAPSWGLQILDSFPWAAVRPERGLLCFASQGYLNRKCARDEGLIYAGRSTIHLNPCNDNLEYF